MSSEEEAAVAWLRKTVEGDVAAAKIISSGGFSPERWDTEPPGQVNPEDIAASDGINAALGLEPEDFPGWSPSWVQLVAYAKLNNEPDEAYGRDSDTPFALVDNGRREFDHIIRHDPRNVVARCEAELAILDEHQHVPASYKVPQFPSNPPFGCIICGRNDDGTIAPVGWCATVRLLASGYKHRPGYPAVFAAG